jgi:hypothetical protein
MDRFALVFVTAALVFAATMASAEPSAATLWKARGLEAIEKLERMKKESKVITSGKRRTAFETQFALEVAYSMHADPVATKVVHKVESEGKEAFHVFLGSKTGHAFDLVYLYEHGKLLGARIDSLPEDWRVVFIADSSDNSSFVVAAEGDGGGILFWVTNPLNAAVLGE